MGVVLQADNRVLLENSKYSFLQINYSSGVSAMAVQTAADFLPGDYLVLGNFGSEFTEIVQVDYVTIATQTLTFTTATKFPHSESTRVTSIPYNQVRFFHTSTTTFSAGQPVRMNVSLGDETTRFDISNPAGTTFRYTYDATGTNPRITEFVQTGRTVIIDSPNFNASNNGTFTTTGVGTNYFEVTNASGVVEANLTIGNGSILVNTNYLDLEADSFFTKIYDLDNITGYGWFVFYNSTTLKASQNSNAIPYGGFEWDTVQAILASFESLLNNKELKLVTFEDELSWLNEAYAITRNELNLVNYEYSASDEYVITTAANIKEYALPSNFSNIVSVFNNESYQQNRRNMDFIPLENVSDWDAVTSNRLRYYLRGAYIGFSPTPTSAIDIPIRYDTKTTPLNSLFDTVTLPDNNFFHLKDYMMFRASPKLGRGQGEADYQKFMTAVNRMKVVANKRDANKDIWGIENYANV